MARGQVSVILILVLVVVVTFVMVMNRPQPFSSSSLPLSDIPDVVRADQAVFEECGKGVFHDGLLFVMFNGGYYHPPDPSILVWFIRVPLDQPVPSLDAFQGEIESYVERNLPGCLDGMRSRPFVLGPPRADVVISRGGDDLVVRYPLQFSSGSARVLYEGFRASSSIPALRMRSAAVDVAGAIAGAEGIPLTKLDDVAARHGLKLDQLWFEDRTAVYSIIQDVGLEVPLVWSLAHKYALGVPG